MKTRARIAWCGGPRRSQLPVHLPLGRGQKPGTVVLGGLLGLCLWTGAPVPLGAATLCVNPGGTGGCFSTIAAAVSAASSGDTINVAAGTYGPPGESAPVSINKDVTIQGAGADQTFIDAGGSGPVLSISASVNLLGLTIQNGKNGGGGGGILFFGSILTISDSVIRNNTAGGGGGGLASFSGGSITITNSTFSGNSAGGGGGGIGSFGASITIIKST
jgi:hypothetical protein